MKKQNTENILKYQTYTAITGIVCVTLFATAIILRPSEKEVKIRINYTCETIKKHPDLQETTKRTLQENAVLWDLCNGDC